MSKHLGAGAELSFVCDACYCSWPGLWGVFRTHRLFSILLEFKPLSSFPRRGDSLQWFCSCLSWGVREIRSFEFLDRTSSSLSIETRKLFYDNPKKKNKTTRTLSELATFQSWNLLDCETRQTTARQQTRKLWFITTEFFFRETNLKKLLSDEMQNEGKVNLPWFSIVVISNRK